MKKVAYLGLLLLLGIAIGFLAGWGKGHGREMNPLDLSAALVLGQPAGQLKQIDDDSFSTGIASGHLRADMSGNRFYLRLFLDSKVETTVRVSYPAATCVFQALQQQNQASPSWMVAEGELRTSHNGKNTYLFEFECAGQTPGTIQLQIQAEQVLYFRQIDLPGGE